MRRLTGDLRRSLVGAGFGAVACWRASPSGELVTRAWVIVVVVTVLGLFAAAAPAVQAGWRHAGAVPTVLLAVLSTVYACVPETDQVPEVLAVVLVLLAIETSTDRPRWWLSVPVAAWVMWAGLAGGAPRESAMVGALFAWWPVVLVSVLAITAPQPAARTAWVEQSVVVGVALVVAVVVARWGALGAPLAPVVWQAVAAATFSGLVCALVRARAAARVRSRSQPAPRTARSDARSRPR